jgi:hypothetical protein
MSKRQQIGVSRDDQVGLCRFRKSQHGVVIAVTADWHSRRWWIDDFGQFADLRQDALGTDTRRR